MTIQCVNIIVLNEHVIVHNNENIGTSSKAFWAKKNIERNLIENEQR